MKKTIAFLLLCTLLSASALFAQKAAGDDRGRAVIVPGSSQENPGDQGLKAHTNHVVMVHPAATGTAPTGETPSSIRGVYNLPSTGGRYTIAIVDAFDYPSAEADLDHFSQYFGMGPCNTHNGCFQVVYPAGGKPAANCGWAQEAALDIEWAHAMAPSAKIVLVEAASSSFTDLFKAVDAATGIVQQNGPGQVSMSWGGSEFNGENAYDSHFNKANVVYFAASGDVGGQTIYPGVSPNVVSAGGTTINRDASGKFLSETGWSGSGGGPSGYEPRPSYQDAIKSIVGSSRGVPDFSFDADPNSGVSVYDTTVCQRMSGWMVFGGTSVASPSLAGIVNNAGHSAGSTALELTMIYQNMSNSQTYSADFRDIVSGKAAKYKAGQGWDFVTGVGSNLGLLGK